MEKKPISKSKPFNSYLKYSGMAFQMLGAIIICLFLGKYLDKKFDTEPIFTAGLAVFGVLAGMYIPIRSILKK